MNKTEYEAQLKKLQTQLVYLQEWVALHKKKVVIVFEGRDASGKGGVIKAITQRLNPRVVRIAALTKPTEVEKSQWYFQRYVAHLPSGGEIVLFDRSWYNRAGVERVMDFCTDSEYQEFLRAAPLFEEMLINSGVSVLKYWFSVSDEEQEKRFNERINNPLKRWKISDMDMYARSRWVAYSKARDAMFEYTDTQICPWYLVNADDKKRARLNCITHILSHLDWQEPDNKKIKLPKIERENYQRPPLEKYNWIPENF